MWILTEWDSIDMIHDISSHLFYQTGIINKTLRQKYQHFQFPVDYKYPAWKEVQSTYTLKNTHVLNWLCARIVMLHITVTDIQFPSRTKEKCELCLHYQKPPQLQLLKMVYIRNKIVINSGFYCYGWSLSYEHKAAHQQDKHQVTLMSYQSLLIFANFRLIIK